MLQAGLADYENYYKYFGENRFKTQPTYGGTYQNNKGHYDLINEGWTGFYNCIHELEYLSGRN